MVEINFSPGDEVRFRLALEELDGTVLESEEKEIVLIKLKSGYNIGLLKENILAYRILKKFEEKTKEYQISQTKELPSVGLILTGGTIASKVSGSTGGVKPITDYNEFLHYYPELLNLVHIKRMEIPFMVFSENMTSEHWIKIAQICKDMLDDENIKGVIISHGTDTLHYTSSALSFFLGEIGKPVVLTYSQRSIDRASSDAKLNLECAARMAISDAAGVMLVGHANSEDDYCLAIPGSKARKLHSSKRDAFKVINGEPLAKVWPDKVEFLASYKKRNNNKIELDISYSDKVALVKFYPGQNPEILEFYGLKYKGIIIEAAGLGQVNENWIPIIRKLTRNGLVICITSQTINGRVNPYVYSTAREMEKAGCIFLEDMTSETALVKLGFVLGHYGWKKEVKNKMLTNFNGELNSRVIN